MRIVQLISSSYYLAKGYLHRFFTSFRTLILRLET